MKSYSMYPIFLERQARVRSWSSFEAGFGIPALADRENRESEIIIVTSVWRDREFGVPRVNVAGKHLKPLLWTLYKIIIAPHAFVSKLN